MIVLIFFAFVIIVAEATDLAEFAQNWASVALHDCTQALTATLTTTTTTTPPTTSPSSLCSAFAEHFDTAWRAQLAQLAASKDAVDRFVARVAASRAWQSALHADLRLHIAMLAERVSESSSSTTGVAELLDQLLVSEFFVAFWLRVEAPADAAAALRETAALVADFRHQFQHIVAQQAVDAGLATVESVPCADEGVAAAAAAAARGPGRPVKLKMRDSPSKPQQATILKQQSADDVKRVLTPKKDEL